MTKLPEDYSELLTLIIKADEPIPKDYKQNPSSVLKPQQMTTIHEEAANQENLRRVNTTDKKSTQVIAKEIKVIKFMENQAFHKIWI